MSKPPGAESGPEQRCRPEALCTSHLLGVSLALSSVWSSWSCGGASTSLAPCICVDVTIPVNVCQWHLPLHFDNLPGAQCTPVTCLLLRDMWKSLMPRSKEARVPPAGACAKIETVQTVGSHVRWIREGPCKAWGPGQRP